MVCAFKHYVAEAKDFGEYEANENALRELEIDISNTLTMDPETILSGDDQVFVRELTEFARFETEMDAASIWGFGIPQQFVVTCRLDNIRRHFMHKIYKLLYSIFNSTYKKSSVIIITL